VRPLDLAVDLVIPREVALLAALFEEQQACHHQTQALVDGVGLSAGEVGGLHARLGERIEAGRIDLYVNAAWIEAAHFRAQGISLLADPQKLHSSLLRPAHSVFNPGLLPP